MPSFAVTQPQLLDSLNTILQSPIGIGQNTIGYWNGDGGYIPPNNLPPYIQDTSPSTSIPDRTTIFTPAQATINSFGEQDRVIISAQCRPFLEWSATDPNTDFNVFFSITRYYVTNIGYKTNTYIDPVELAQDNNVFTGNTGNPGTISIGDTIFVSIIDNPGIGRWFYVLDLFLRVNDGDPDLQSVYLENISLSATLLKF